MSKVQSGNISNVGGSVNQSYVDNSKTKIINKNKISIIVGVLVLFVFIIGAYIIISKTNSPENLILGKWYKEGTSKEYEFTKDGKFLYLSGMNEVDITYKVDGNRLYLNINILWANSTVSADIDVSKDHLSLSNFRDPDQIFGVKDGETWEFTRD